MASEFDWESYNPQSISEVEEKEVGSNNNQGFQEEFISEKVQEPSSSTFDWSSYNPMPINEVEQAPDSFLKSLARTGLQVPQGLLEFTPPALAASIFELAAMGEGVSALQDLDEQRINELKQKFPTAPWENFKGIDKEKYMENLRDASSLIPTVRNIASEVEKRTGLPLEPRTRLDKAFRLAGSKGKISTGKLAERARASALTGAAKLGLDASGVPEIVADPLALGIGGLANKVKAEPVLKKSGLPERNFEGLKKERKINPAQAERLKESVEKDVKKITDDLMQSKSQTARSMRHVPEFEKKLSDGFDKVEKLAYKLQETVPSATVKKALLKKMNDVPKKGFARTESSRLKQKELSRLYKTIPNNKPISTGQLYEQFRENNKEFSKVYKPLEASAVNEAKTNALLEFNTVISDAIEKIHPDTEFSKLFKFTNKVYKQSKDMDTIDGFLDKVFDKKINFKEAKKFSTDNKLKKSFENILGKEGYEDMSQIMNDFMSTEKAHSLIKEAKSVGAFEAVKLAGKFMIHPVIGKASAANHATKFIRNQILPNKKYRLIWKKAGNDFKKGKFKEAEAGFSELEKLRIEESKK